MPRFNIIFVISLVLLCICCSTSKEAGTGKCKNSENNIYDKSEIKTTLGKIAVWQMSNLKYNNSKNLHDYGIDSWTNSTFYMGLFRWAETDNNNPVYLRWLDNIGRTIGWIMPGNFIDHPKYRLYHADEFCIGQLYLDMFNLYGDSVMMRSVKERADWVMNNPPNPDMGHKNKQSWTWCDALFMAPQVYARLALIENDDKYFQFMDSEFKRTCAHLYDKEDKMFYRDDKYFNQTEKNGKKVFWGRGNGWVAAGIVNILKLLPSDSEYRPYYENLYREFVPQMVALQDSTGFWHASLLDPESYPAPETSATALLTYAIAYGINNDLLDAKIYCPSLEKAWTALLSVVDENGKVCWVQPIGADPKNVKADMTASYGVGAFLLAGNEIYLMNR